jgi:hypothetical protein
MRVSSDLGAPLERYCEVVGVSVFEPESYGPDAVVVETQVTLPQDGLVVSLRQAQALLGIVQGMAATVRG